MKLLSTKFEDLFVDQKSESLITPWVVAVSGSSAESDCAILEFPQLLRVTCKSPVLHPYPPVPPFCAERPAFLSPRHTHFSGAASGGLSGLQGLLPSLGCLRLSFLARWCLLRPVQAALAATALGWQSYLCCPLCTETFESRNHMVFISVLRDPAVLLGSNIISDVCTSSEKLFQTVPQEWQHL